MERAGADSARGERPKFRQRFRLLVPADCLMNDPGLGDAQQSQAGQTCADACETQPRSPSFVPEAFEGIDQTGVEVTSRILPGVAAIAGPLQATRRVMARSA